MVCSPSFSSLSIQNSIFDGNYSIYSDWGYGLFIVNGLGDVTLNNIQSSGNSSGTGSSGFSDGTYVKTMGSVIVDSSQFNNNTKGNGLEVDANGNITITCSQFLNNSLYGVNIDIHGTLSLNSDKFSGNGSGDFTNPEGTTVIGSTDCAKNKKVVVNGPSLPLQIVNVTSGQSVGLDCANFRGTELILPDGDSLTLLCPLLGDARLTSVKSDGLPGGLPNGDTFTSAFTASVLKGAKPMTDLGNSAIVSFVIPSGASGKSFAILFRDGSK